MPPEVLDLISDFLMELDTTSPRPFDPHLGQKVQSLQNLRYTCRQLVSPQFLSSLTNISITIRSLAFIFCPFFMLNVYNTAPNAYVSVSNNLPPEDLSIPNNFNIKSISLSIRNHIKNRFCHTDESRLSRPSRSSIGPLWKQIGNPCIDLGKRGLDGEIEYVCLYVAKVG